MPGSKAVDENRRRNVSFLEKVHVKCVSYALHLVPDRDPRRLWYNQEDYDTIFERSCDLIDLYVEGQPQKEKKGAIRLPRVGVRRRLSITTADEIPSILRGLESLIDKLDKKKDDVKSKAWDAVLDEQFLQRDAGKVILDDREISNAYKLCTFKSQREAIKRAQQDERDVRKYLKATKQHRYGTSSMAKST